MPKTRTKRSRGGSTAPAVVKRYILRLEKRNAQLEDLLKEAIGEEGDLDLDDELAELLDLLDEEDDLSKGEDDEEFDDEEEEDDDPDLSKWDDDYDDEEYEDELDDAPMTKRIKQALASGDSDVVALVKGLTKKADDAMAIAKSERDKRHDSERLAKAAQFSHVGGAEEIAGILKGVEGTDVEEEVERVLKAANAQLESSALFNELGTLASTAAGDDPIMKRAKEIQKGNSDLTEEQAYAEALEEHPELYDQYLAEQGA